MSRMMASLKSCRVSNAGMRHDQSCAAEESVVLAAHRGYTHQLGYLVYAHAEPLWVGLVI